MTNKAKKKTVKVIDYKDGATLGKYLSRWDRIKPASATRLSAKDQRKLAEAIKRARFLALLPYVKR